MKRFSLIIVLILSFQFLVSAQSVKKLSFSELETYLKSEKENLIILNFWATWCKPCVEELPDFDKAGVLYADKKVKLIFVNLDFHSQVEKLVIPFLKKREFKSEFWHLTDQDPNLWIDKIAETWGGAIPATAFIGPGFKKLKFHEGKFSFEELEIEIQSLLLQINKTPN